MKIEHNKDNGRKAEWIRKVLKKHKLEQVSRMAQKSDGFTLIELIVVIATLGIIVAIVTPSLSGFKSKAEDVACAANRKTLEGMYSAFLVENDINAESVFDQFIIENFDEICPVSGVIRYEDGKVKCSIHNSGSEGEEDEPEDEVPWL